MPFGDQAGALSEVVSSRSRTRWAPVAASMANRSRWPPVLRVNTSRVPVLDSTGSASLRTAFVVGCVRLRTALVTRSIRSRKDSPVLVDTLVT